MAYCQVVIMRGYSADPNNFSFTVSISACDDEGVSYNIEETTIDVAIAASIAQQTADIREAARAMIIGMGGPDVPANQVKVF